VRFWCVRCLCFSTLSLLTCASCLLPFARCYRQLFDNQLSGTIPPSVGSLTSVRYLCVCPPSHRLPHKHAERRLCTASGSVPLALHVRVLLVLLHLVVSDMCVVALRLTFNQPAVLNHSFTRSLTGAFIHSPVRAPTRSLIPSFSRPPTHSLTCSFIHVLIN
jgi:hypothetical protein